MNDEDEEEANSMKGGGNVGKKRDLKKANSVQSPSKGQTDKQKPANSKKNSPLKREKRNEFSEETPSMKR